MRTFLRVVAGLNAVFQGLLGVLLAGSGLVSAVVARNPEANPGLPAAYALTCVLNLAADTLVGLSGAMRFSQLAIGMLLQAILVIAVAANSRRPGPPISRPA